MLIKALWNSNVLCQFSSQVVIHSRHFNIKNANQASNTYLSRQGKFMSKLVFGSSKKKRKFIFDDTQGPAGNKLNLGQHIRYNKENSRRVAVLNSLFMKHISDLLVTGNVGADVMNKGLEISRVSMNPNFNQLNVFWGCNKDENIIELENILPNVGYTLRHELSQLKVMGVVPRIQFVKDKHFTDGAKVDYLLGIADFGDDHEPSELESDFTSDSVAPVYENKPISKKHASEEKSLLDEELLPPMRQDTFNLDHQYIMSKILKRMQKSKAIHRHEPNLAIKSDGNSIRSSIQEVERMTKEERKEALSKFILSRKILQEKKMQNKHNSDLESFSKQEITDEDVEDEDFYVEDYIEEHFEEENYKN